MKKNFTALFTEIILAYEKLLKGWKVSENAPYVNSDFSQALLSVIKNIFTPLRVP